MICWLMSRLVHGLLMVGVPITPEFDDGMDGRVLLIVQLGQFRDQVYAWFL